MSSLFLLTKQSSAGFIHFSAVYQRILSYSTVSSFRIERFAETEQKGFNKALKDFDFVIPKSGTFAQPDCHQRLIQSCLQDLLKIDQKKGAEPVEATVKCKLINRIQPTPNCSPESDISSFWRTLILAKKDSLILFPELHKRGIIAESTTLSRSISSCGAKGALNTGQQLHTFAIKVGFDSCTHIGSSLISLYSKCSKLDSAYRVFAEMSTKDTVLWTAIIAAYAQHWQVRTCLYLFDSMRHSNSKPNDFTCASLLTLCTNCGSLALGRSFHCLGLRMGYDSYTHVSNALISMYAKCGSIREAYCVFETMPWRDLISWNSMIFGYAHYGIADRTLLLLKEMDIHKILPDAITFLGVLSSFRHSGLVHEGRACFNLMLQRGINPGLDHYSCIIDLLGRNGLLKEAVEFIQKMPIPPNAVIWGSLLSSSRLHGDVWVGIHAAERRLLLERGCAATHVQLANLYASAGCWDNVAKIRKLMKERGLKTIPGYSWIEIGNEVYRFRAEDGTNTQLKEMLLLLELLEDHLHDVQFECLEI